MKKEIKARYGDRFLVGAMSARGVVIKDEEPEEVFLTKLFSAVDEPPRTRWAKGK